VHIDARALQTFDTSAIALLLQARRLAQAAGRGLEITGAPAKLAELARLYGVEELLSLSPSAPRSAP
jgi:phospholipid transport system transporter-binding protein